MLYCWLSFTFCCFIIMQSHWIVDYIYIYASRCNMLYLIECPTNCNTCADRAGTMTCTVCNTGYALDSNSACVSEYFLNQYYIFINIWQPVLLDQSCTLAHIFLRKKALANQNAQVWISNVLVISELTSNHAIHLFKTDIFTSYSAITIWLILLEKWRKMSFPLLYLIHYYV